MTELENSIKTLTEHTQNYVPTEDLEHLYAVIEAAEKVSKYETAEEEGRFVVLPCKVGTRVYEIYQFCGCGAWEIEEHKIKLEDLDKIGKTVFPTREEAEKALKEMEGKQSE